MRQSRLILFGLLLSVAAAPALAQFAADSDAPIEISADTMEWQQDDQIAIARGEADAIQGRYHLHADKLTAYLSKSEAADADADAESSTVGAFDKISRIEADGNVVLTTPEEMARGTFGTYDVEARTATLTGSVVLTQGDNVMRGERLVMDLVTGKSTLLGTPTVQIEEETGSGSTRVRALFKPETSDGAEDGAEGRTEP